MRRNPQVTHSSHSLPIALDKIGSHAQQNCPGSLLNVRLAAQAKNLGSKGCVESFDNLAAFVMNLRDGGAALYPASQRGLGNKKASCTRKLPIAHKTLLFR